MLPDCRSLRHIHWQSASLQLSESSERNHVFLPLPLQNTLDRLDEAGFKVEYCSYDSLSHFKAEYCSYNSLSHFKAEYCSYDSLSYLKAEYCSYDSLSHLPDRELYIIVDSLSLSIRLCGRVLLILIVLGRLWKS